MEKMSWNVRGVQLIIALLACVAACDLFRAYLNVHWVNLIFSLKEVLILASFAYLFPYIYEKKKWLFFFSLLIIYMFLNSFRSEHFLLFPVFLKYMLVFILSYLIFSSYNNYLEFAFKLVVWIYLIYSIITVIAVLIYPDSMFNLGRVSGFANPSFLSYVYLLCFIYCFFNNRKIVAWWFIFVALLTMTKTLFVVLPCVISYLIMFTPKRLQTVGAMASVLLLFMLFTHINKEINMANDKAVTVLLQKDEKEYNSLSARLERMSRFEAENSNNLFIGSGTGMASSAGVFLQDKLGIKTHKTVDFENQFLNIFYSLGILGLMGVYYVFLQSLWQTFRSKVSIKYKHALYLFFGSFFLYNITLDMIEAFTTCVLSVLFLLLWENKLKKANQMPEPLSV